MAGYGPKAYRDQGGNRQVIASGGTLEIEAGGVINDNPAVGGSKPGIVFMHDVVVPQSTAATPATINTTISHRFQILDVTVLRTGGNSASTVSTIQVQTSTGGAITDAVDIKKVDKTICRAATIDDALHIVGTSLGGVIRVVRAGSIGAGSAGRDVSSVVRITGVKRST